jgi:hypothetical protein
MCALSYHGPLDTPKPVATAPVVQQSQRKHHSRRELIRRARELGIHR